MGIITLYICLICLLLLFIFLCYVVKNRKMKIWIHGGLCIFLILLVAIPVGVYWANHQQNQLRITEITQPEDIMRHIVETNRDTILSVGIWQDGSEEKYLYTVNGKQEFVPYTYQIGSITKTFTGAMIAYEEEKGLEDTSYQNAMNHFIQNELNREHTKVGGVGDFADNWIWHDHDEMMGDGAITSNLTDVLEYGKRYLEKDASYAYLKRAIKGRAGVDDDYDIGMFWIIGKGNGIIWHNGEISMEREDGKEVGYQCFIGISPEKNKVVVVLSNGICNDKSETAYTDLLGYLLLSA